MWNKRGKFYIKFIYDYIFVGKIFVLDGFSVTSVLFSAVGTAVAFTEVSGEVR